MKSFSNVLGESSGARTDDPPGGLMEVEGYTSLSDFALAALAAAANRGPLIKSLKGENDMKAEEDGGRKYSLTALWTLAMENDIEIGDELTKAQKKLAELKDAISIQSKRNFILEKNVRVLDNRIALLIQNHMALDESQDFKNLSVSVEVKPEMAMRDSRRRQLYGHIFFLLQSEPKYLAALMNHIKMDEIDSFLETVIFTIYGNQYDTREEFLLLKMLRFVLSATWEDIPSRELGNLLRANNPVSRIITAYTRRGSGQTYLKNKLHELVNGIVNIDKDLEINPDVICKNSSGSTIDALPSLNLDSAGDNPRIKALIEERAAEIIKATTICMDKIINSVDDVPYGIRWICKQVRSLVKRNCSDLGQDDLSVLVGGVFFLRFINPAITVPETSGLVNSQVNRRQRRALTLVSKIIQSASNKPAQSREAYMSVFNPLIESLKGPVNKFLSDVCNVSDFFDALEMEQYITLTKKQLKMNVSLQDIYTIHQLLIKYSNEIIRDDNNRLKKCLDELDNGHPITFNKSDNKVFSLELIRNWEHLNQENTSNLSSTEFTKRDILYMDTKAICIQILRSIPSLTKNLNFSSSSSTKIPLNTIDPRKIADAACSSRNSTLYNKGKRLKELIKELEYTYQPAQSSVYNQVMCEEIRNELENLGNLKERVENEIRSLEDVNKSLNEQYTYLMAQLESYKAYLVNVRSQSGSAKVSSRSKSHHQGPLRLSYYHLDKDGIIITSQIPESCRSSTFFHFYTPAPGSYAIAIRYIGRQEDILQMKLSLDDLLEKQESGDNTLDLDCVKLSVTKVLQLINKHFLKR